MFLSFQVENQVMGKFELEYIFIEGKGRSRARFSLFCLVFVLPSQRFLVDNLVDNSCPMLGTYL